jgi:nitrate/nitrite transporter NarK
LAQIVSGIANGPFWALHHAAVEHDRHVSIAVVNCIGNLGGFVGPVVLGALHDRLGPACPAGIPTCVEQWGWGCVVLAGGMIVGTCATAVAALLLRIPG